MSAYSVRSLFVVLLKYIELNPVRAGICQSAEGYAHSLFGRCQENHSYEKEFIEHILSLSVKEIKMPDFKSNLAQEMKIMQTNDFAAFLTGIGVT